MKEFNIANRTDIEAVAAWIEKHADHIHKTDPPAIKVINCVLSLNRNYDIFVVPRLNAFVENHPEIRTVNQLATLIDSFPTPHAFMHQELKFNYEDRANVLKSVIDFACEIVKNTPDIPEEESLKQWAIDARPEEYLMLNIKGFGIAGFQYLRMLFGADTVKPDIHIRRQVFNIIERDVSNIDLISLLEAAAKQVNISVSAVDSYIWNLKGKVSEQSATNTSEETGDAYYDFWKPILNGELGELFAGEPKSHHSRDRLKRVGDIELWLRITTRSSYIRLYFRGENPLAQRDELMQYFQTSDYNYQYKDTPNITTVIFPVSNNGINDRDAWDEIREKFVHKGTDINNKIIEADL